MPEDIKDPGMAALNQRDLRNSATPVHEPVVQSGFDYDRAEHDEDYDAAHPEPQSEFEADVRENVKDQEEWIDDELNDRHEHRTREDMDAESEMVADAYKEQGDEAKEEWIDAVDPIDEAGAYESSTEQADKDSVAFDEVEDEDGGFHTEDDHAEGYSHGDDIDHEGLDHDHH